MRIPILFLAAVLVYLGRLVLRCPTWLLRVAKAVTTNIRLPAPITSQDAPSGWGPGSLKTLFVLSCITSHLTVGGAHHYASRDPFVFTAKTKVGWGGLEKVGPHRGAAFGTGRLVAPTYTVAFKPLGPGTRASHRCGCRGSRVLAPVPRANSLLYASGGGGVDPTALTNNGGGPGVIQQWGTRSHSGNKWLGGLNLNGGSNSGPR
ncbi:hypothetical protein BHE74_00034801 [Ensete ventricosum]|nr:hypothetical protein BHE74_00034801 [Ensete ventricosum]